MASLKEKIAHNTLMINSGKDSSWLHVPAGGQLLSRKMRWCRIERIEENGSIKKAYLKIKDGQKLAGRTFTWTIGSDVTIWEMIN